MPDVSNAGYAVLLLLHVLLFVYWLGADLAVLYAAHFAADPALSAETRATVADIMAFVDMFPRLSVPLIGAVGAQLAVLGGYAALPAWGMSALWALALLWAANGLYLYRRRRTPALLQPARRLDRVLRVTVLLIALGAALAGLAGVGPMGRAFLIVKLLALAAAIGLSFVLRRTFAPFRPALNRIIEGSGSDEDSLLMRRSLARSRPVVFCLWGSAVVGAAAGLWGSG